MSPHSGDKTLGRNLCGSLVNTGKVGLGLCRAIPALRSDRSFMLSASSMVR